MNQPFSDFHNYGIPVSDPAGAAMDYSQQYSAELSGHGLLIAQDDGSSSLPATAVSIAASSAPLMMSFSDPNSVAAAAAAAAAVAAVAVSHPGTVGAGNAGTVAASALLEDALDEKPHSPSSSAGAAALATGTDLASASGVFDPTAAAVAAMSASSAPRDEEPMYVNAKQYHRILKRRDARARLAAEHKMNVKRKPYLH
ncbi:Transcriptional activator, partial [Coemansia sp. RSA 2610]